MRPTRDGVIPFALGQQLFTGAHGPKRSFTIGGGDHDEVDPPDPDASWRAAGELVEAVSRAGQ